MKTVWKKIFLTLLAVAVALLIGGMPVLIASTLATMLMPLPLAKVLPFLLVGLLICAGAHIGRQLGRRGVKAVWLSYGLLALACLVYAGLGLYRESIPTVDDRTLVLYDYLPFQEDSRLARLEETASLQLSSGQAEGLRMDGATALYPVYAGFVQAVYPQGEYPLYGDSEDGYGDVACSGTIGAYERLIAGEVDVIFVAGPSQDQLDAAAAAGLALHMTPIGKEAFVFFVNALNPVTDLTVEQIQGIYTGEITNWKELGGRNQRIRPFQRAENSGSQTALLSLMAGKELMEPEEEDRVAGMGGIIRQVASYRNYKNAIGFSFRFYATEMVSDNQIRLLSLNGVEPTKQTIRDGTYPISSFFYAITASPAGTPPPEDSDPELAALLAWILSPQGQQIVEQTGYVAVG